MSRYILVLLGILALANCSSGGTDNTNPGTIAVVVDPTSGTATPAGQAVTTATLTRGGGFTGTVNFTVAGAPAGVTGAASNVATVGITTTATVTITVAATVAPGSYPLVLRATGSGVTEATANYLLNVVVPSGNASVSFVGCDPVDQPVWFASMDGPGGSWTQVPGVADVYRFNITQAKGGLAYVTDDGGMSSIFVRYFTQAELTSGQMKFCNAFVPGKTVNGQLLNMGGSTFTDIINFGGRSISPTLNAPFQINNVPDGLFDLIAYERQPLAIGSGDRLFIERGENPAPGGNFTVPVDFLDPLRSSPPDAGSVTLSGLNGDSETSSMSFLTGPACTPSVLYTGIQGLGTANAYGVPASLRAAGDMHQFSVQMTSGIPGFTRFLTENFVDLHARIVTPFLMPAALPFTAFSDAGGHYKRPMMVVNGVPAEYNQSHSLSYADFDDFKSGFIFASQGYVGGSGVTLTLPDFHGVGSFLDSWAPISSDKVSVIAMSNGASGEPCSAGARVVSASRTGAI